MKFFILLGFAAVKSWWGGRENFVCMPCSARDWPPTGPVVCVQFEYRGQHIYQDELLSHCPSENRS